MNRADQIASVLAGLAERAPQMRAIFAIDIPAERGLATFSIAPCDVGTPEQLDRVRDAMAQLRDAIADIVAPAAPMTRADEAREAGLRG